MKTSTITILLLAVTSLTTLIIGYSVGTNHNSKKYTTEEVRQLIAEEVYRIDGENRRAVAGTVSNPCSE